METVRRCNSEVMIVQSELEDLCFAILHPECYRRLYLERNDLWQKKMVSPSVLEEADRMLARSQVPPPLL